MSKKPVEKKQPSTTGHQWDGIEELNNPLPRWWLWTFYACVVWGVAYSIAMPAWPLINGATPGIPLVVQPLVDPSVEAFEQRIDAGARRHQSGFERIAFGLQGVHLLDQQGIAARRTRQLDLGRRQR